MWLRDLCAGLLAEIQVDLQEAGITYLEKTHFVNGEYYQEESRIFALS
jgi:hypothetical protein